MDPDDPDSDSLISLSTSSPYSSVAGVELPSSAPTLLVSKGASSEPPLVEPLAFASEGDISCLVSKGIESHVPSQLPACEGEILRMPEFTNLKTAGFCRSARSKKKSTKALEADQMLETKKLS